MLVVAATALDGATTPLGALGLRLAAGWLSWRVDAPDARPLARRAASGRPDQGPRASPPGAVLALLTVAVVGAYAWLSPAPGPARQAWLHVVATAAVYLALVTAAPALRRGALITCAAGGGLHAAVALGQRLAGATRGRGGFFSPDDLGALLAPQAALAAAVALGVLGPTLSRPRRRAAAMLAALYVLGLAATGGRAAALGATLAGLLVCWPSSGAAACVRARWPGSGAAGCVRARWPSSGAVGGVLARRPTSGAAAAWLSGPAAARGTAAGPAGARSRWPRRAGGAVAAALATLLLLAPQASRWRAVGDPYAYARLAIWRVGAMLAWQHRPWGVGLGAAAAALRRAGVPLHGWVRYPRVAAEPHCEVLRAALEMGWPGLCVALAAPAWLVAVGRPRRATVALVVAFGVPACAGATLHNLPVAMLAAVLAAALVAGDAQGPAGPADTSAPAPALAPMAGPGPAAAADGGAKPPLRRAKPWAPAVAAALRLWPPLALLAPLVWAVPPALGAAAQQGAAALRDRGALREAEQLARVAVVLRPSDPGAALMVPSLAAARGRPWPAVAAELAALRDRFPDSCLAPRRAAAWLGALAARGGRGAPDWATVARAHAAAAACDPHDALLRAAAGDAWARAGDAAAAQAAWTAALAEEPACHRALAALAARSTDPLVACALAGRAARAAAAAASRGGYGHQILRALPAGEDLFGAVMGPSARVGAAARPAASIGAAAPPAATVATAPR